MPIEVQFTEFANEADFTDRFLVPLLRRLGYFAVCRYHGSQEFGKDLVFAEIDRFNCVVYHGLQAKYLSSIGQSESDALVRDCREAFNNPFRHPQTGANERIGSFTVANAGSIADNARTNFFNASSGPQGGHVRMLDGKTLVQLDRSAAIRQGDLVGGCLSGLRLELRYNNMLIKERLRDSVSLLARQPGVQLPLERLRLAAVSAYLTRPVLSDRIDIDSINDYWHSCANIINPGLDHLTRDTRNPGGSFNWNPEVRTVGSHLCATMDRVVLIGETTVVAIDVVLSQLGPITST